MSVTAPAILPAAPFVHIYRHTHGPRACGDIAFYSRKRWKMGDLLESTDVRFPDGSQPQAGESVLCGSCGRPLILKTPNLGLELSRG